MGGKKSEVRIIKDHLLTLGLEERRPSFTEVRKAFRVKVLNHPDKGGSLPAFQEITQAVREVLAFLSTYPTKADMEEERGDTELLKVFESSSGVKYHDGSVTFCLEEGRVEEWRSTLQEYFKDAETKEKEGKHSVQFQHPMWPLLGLEGELVTDSLSVTLYPSCSEPKVLVQGKLYLLFLTQVLPRMALSLGKDKSEIKAILGNEEEEEIIVDKQATEKKEDESDTSSVNDSIKRLERAFMEKMDVNMKYQVASHEDLKAVKEEVKALREEVKTIKDSVPKVPQPLGSDSVQSLTSKIDTTTQEVKSKIDEVKVSVNKVLDITKETSNDVKKINTSYVDIKTMLASMHSKLDTMQKSLDRSSQLARDQSPASPASPASKVQEVEEVVEDEEEVVEVKKREGIIFTCSVGTKIDTEKWEGNQ